MSSERTSSFFVMKLSTVALHEGFGPPFHGPIFLYSFLTSFYQLASSSTHSSCYMNSFELFHLQVNILCWIYSLPLILIQNYLCPNSNSWEWSPSLPDHLSELVLTKDGEVLAYVYHDLGEMSTVFCSSVTVLCMIMYYKNTRDRDQGSIATRYNWSINSSLPYAQVWVLFVWVPVVSLHQK